MKNSLSKILAPALLAALGAGAFGQHVTLKPVTSGAMPKMGGYMPQRLQLSATAPGGLKKAPAKLDAPLYGVLTIGKKSFIVIVDRPDSGPTKLYVDTNGDGNLTNDPAPTWTAAPYKSQDGKPLTRFTGTIPVAIGLAGTDKPVSLGAYIFDKNDAARAALKDVLLYYTDYGYEGDVTLGGKTYRSMLTDDMAKGDFTGTPGERGSGVRILIDVNGNGKYDRQGEAYDVSKPFNIAGTTYEIKNLTPQGGSFDVVVSSQTVAEILPPPDLSNGKKAIEFNATTLDGKPITFPGSFKGKIVLLDFWATWCGPCIGEMPNVISAYNKYHDKGFEILGISLDNAQTLPGIQKFLDEHKMPWAQVADGKYWDAAVAKLYVVQSIPQAYIVDGDTGEILAQGNDIRGEGLAKAIEAAFAKKASKAGR